MKIMLEKLENEEPTNQQIVQKIRSVFYESNIEFAHAPEMMKVTEYSAFTMH